MGAKLMTRYYFVSGWKVLLLPFVKDVEKIGIPIAELEFGKPPVFYTNTEYITWEQLKNYIITRFGIIVNERKYHFPKWEWIAGMVEMRIWFSEMENVEGAYQDFEGFWMKARKEVRR